MTHFTEKPLCQSVLHIYFFNKNMYTYIFGQQLKFAREHNKELHSKNDLT